MRILNSFFLILIMLSCKENRDIFPEKKCNDSTDINCPNYDSCLVKKPVSADFLIEYNFAGIGQDWQPEESHIWQGDVRFTAIEEDADYTWYLGSEIIKDRSFIRNFSKVGNGATIVPTLVVNKFPDTACFPSDDGHDSLSKNLTVLNTCDYLFSNTWRGSWERSPLDTFEIAIELFHQVGEDPDECTGIRITNINGDNGGYTGNCIDDKSLTESVAFSHRFIRFLIRSRTTEPCNGPFGYALVNPDNKTIYMEYRLKFDSNGNGSFGDDDYEIEPRKFSGYAID